MMPNTCNNNPSLSAAKTSTFSGRTFTSHNCPEGLHCSPFAALSLSTEHIGTMFSPIRHLDTNTWGIGSRFEKYQCYPLNRAMVRNVCPAAPRAFHSSIMSAKASSMVGVRGPLLHLHSQGFKPSKEVGPSVLGLSSQPHSICVLLSALS